jgi:hypothetical protein
MKKQTKMPSLVTIAILTAVTVIFWIGFGVYRIFTSKPSPPVPREIILPVNPNLDTTILNGLQNKIYFTESQIGATVIERLTEPSPSPEATKTETVPESELGEEEVPVATGEGETANEEI